MASLTVPARGTLSIIREDYTWYRGVVQLICDCGGQISTEILATQEDIDKFGTTDAYDKAEAEALARVYLARDKCPNLAPIEQV